MKKIFLFASIFALLSTITLNSQVTIGDSKPPHESSILQVVSPKNNKGILVPGMTEANRDAIKNPADGLLIYNTDENCFNYYSATDGEWKSMCGGIAKSAVSLSCDDVVMVYGSYTEGTPLNSSNYLVITVNVTKIGAYTITATTKNGYGFHASGTFLNKGLQQVILIGQGSPEKSLTSGDIVSLTVNGSEATFTCPTPAPVVIQVASANPAYSMDCGSVTVNGTYNTGVSLKASNSITVNVDIKTLGNGQWTASTNTVDGIFFSGNGVFTATGPNTITLNGFGTPTSAQAKIMTITLNSTGIAKTCTATVNCVYTPKKILVMGYCTAPFGGPNPNTYGYSLNGNRASYNMVMAAVNFGTTASSTVKVQGLTINGLSGSTLGTSTSISLGALPTDDGLKTALATNPDIVVIGWGMIYSTDMISQFTDYLNHGGVMIIMNKYSNSSNANNSEAPFFTSLFGTTVTAATITDTSGAVLGGGTSFGSLFRLASISGDPILKGPFGDLNGLLWGNDYFPATYMRGIPDSQIITYSGANVVGGSSNTGVTMFRHKTLNLFWVGDGGFLSNENSNGSYGSNNIEPFATDASNVPVARTNFGSAAINGGMYQTVYNSKLFANVLAWAIQQAETNGINKK